MSEVSAGPITEKDTPAFEPMPAPVQTRKPRYPKNVTEEQVAAWKAEFHPLTVRMGTLGVKKTIFRPYLRKDIVSGNIVTKEDVMSRCCLYIDGGIGAATEGEKIGLLELIELASGAPESKMNLVVGPEDLESEFLADLKKRNPEAGNAVTNSINQHGAALVFGTMSRFEGLNGLWVFAPVTSEDQIPMDDNEKLISYILTKKLMFPGPILDSGSLLAGHYAELTTAINGLLGFAPTSEIIEL